MAGNAGPTITRNVRILDLPPLEILEGFSVTPAGTWTDGVRIANPTHVSTFQIGTATYAGISSDKGLAIINITDIGSPAHVSFINDVADASIASFEPRSTTFVSIDGSTYALSPYSTSMAIIKVSNSGSLSTVSAVTDGSGGYTKLNGGFSVATATIDSSTYALVASVNDNGVQIINITKPGSPIAASATSFMKDTWAGDPMSVMFIIARPLSLLIPAYVAVPIWNVLT